MHEQIHFGCTIKRVASSDWHRIASAFSHSFLDHRSVQEWAWRYQYQYDQQQQSVCWIALSPTGEVGAFIGANIHRGWRHGVEHPFLVMSDNFSHPDWRAVGGSARRGLFTLTELAFHAAGADSGICSLGTGQDRRIRLDQLLGIGKILEDVSWFDCFIIKYPQISGCTCLVQPADFFKSEWDRLWLKRRQQVSMSLIRDSKFLSWRFDQRQRREYWCFEIYTVNVTYPIGYVVASPLASGLAVLVDFILPDTMQVLRDAMQQITQELALRGISRLVTMVSAACPEGKALAAIGFHPCQPLLPVLTACRTYQKSVTSVDVQREYAMTLADSDLY